MTSQTSFKYKIDHASPPFRFLRSMGSTGTDLTVFMEALCQSPRFSWPVNYQMKKLPFLPAQGVSVTDALRLYVETVQVLSRIIAD